MPAKKRGGNVSRPRLFRIHDVDHKNVTSKAESMADVLGDFSDLRLTGIFIYLYSKYLYIKIH
jgi:hypothetical protein